MDFRFFKKPQRSLSRRDAKGELDESIFYMMRLAGSVFKSRGFAVSLLSVLMSLTVYAVSSTTNTVYIRADQQTTILTTSHRDLDTILEECGISGFTTRRSRLFRI